MCGRAFSTDELNSGVMTSPYFPNPYPHNAECEWTVVAPENEVITLTFTDMDIESHDSCEYDYVEVLFFLFLMYSITPRAYTCVLLNCLGLSSDRVLVLILFLL